MKTNLTLLFLFSFIISVYSQENTSDYKKWTLRECVDYAIENNLTVKQSEYDISLAEINRKDAIGNFLPSLNLNGSHSWNSGLTTDVTTGVLRNQTTQTTSGGLSSGILIYGGLQNHNLLRKADLGILANRYQLDKIKDDISLNVINAYLQVLFGKEAVNVALPQLEITREQLNRTNKLVEAGTIPKGDLLEIQATLAGDEQNLIITQNNLQISLISLAQLLQLDNYKDFDVADEEIESLPLVNLANYSVDDVYQKALENRNEIKVAKTNIEIAEKDIKLAKGALQPTLSGFYNWNSRYSNLDRIVGSEINPDNPIRVIGQVEGTGENVITQNFIPVTGSPNGFSDQFFDRNKGSSFGLSLRIPVFNGFKASNNVKRAEIFYDKQKNQLGEEELRLEKIIHTVYADALGALKIYDAAQKSVAAQEEAFRYAQEKFNVGVMNSFEFSQTKNRLVKAHSDFLRSKYDFIFKVKLLEYYYGVPVSDLN
ncbi:MAG: TolC family protein [Flavobacteriaceae bacterium]|nr:TolC family protein [Flavobacteriaceae bacterium]